MIRILTALALVAALVSTAMTSEAYARHGKDDPVGHVRGEGPGHP